MTALNLAALEPETTLISFFTIDDLQTYAPAFGPVLESVYWLADGHTTEEQATEAVRQAAAELRAIHAKMKEEADRTDKEEL